MVFINMCVCVCARACVRAQLLSLVRLCATPWTIAHRAPLSMGFSRKEYWRGLPFPSPGGSSQTRDRSRISCTGRWILYHSCHPNTRQYSHFLHRRRNCKRQASKQKARGCELCEDPSERRASELRAGGKSSGDSKAWPLSPRLCCSGHPELCSISPRHTQDHH